MKMVYLCYDFSKTWVTQPQPATGSNAISLILKLLGVHFIEIMKAANTTK